MGLTSDLGPKVNYQGWVLGFGPRDVLTVWVPLLGHKAYYQDLRLGSQCWSQGWFPRLGKKVWSKVLVQMLGPMLYTRVGPKTLGWVPIVWSQGWFYRSGPKIGY